MILSVFFIFLSGVFFCMQTDAMKEPYAQVDLKESKLSSKFFEEVSIQLQKTIKSLQYLRVNFEKDLKKTDELVRLNLDGIVKLRRLLHDQPKDIPENLELKESGLFLDLSLTYMIKIMLDEAAYLNSKYLSQSAIEKAKDLQSACVNFIKEYYLYFPEAPKKEKDVRVVVDLDCMKALINEAVKIDDAAITDRTPGRKSKLMSSYLDSMITDRTPERQRKLTLSDLEDSMITGRTPERRKLMMHPNLKKYQPSLLIDCLDKQS